VNTSGPGASTDHTPLVEADLEAHSEQSEEAPKIEAQGEESLLGQRELDAEINERRGIAQTRNSAWPHR